jgi:hypothetical protein
VFNANQAARIGEMGAGSQWGSMLARTMLPTTTPQPRLGADGQPNPILTALGQSPAGGPSGLAAGIGRYRPPTGMPAAGSFQNDIFNGLMSRMNVPAGGLARPAAAAGEIGGRTFGDNPNAWGANQALASALPGFRENFGGGRFDAYMNTTASPNEQMTAANILKALGQPNRITWGGALQPPTVFNPTSPVGAGNADQTPGAGTPAGIPGGVGGNMDPYLTPDLLQMGA